MVSINTPYPQKNHALQFALIANFLKRAPVLSALCIVLQEWSTMKLPLGILTKKNFIPKSFEPKDPKKNWLKEKMIPHRKKIVNPENIWPLKIYFPKRSFYSKIFWSTKYYSPQKLRLTPNFFTAPNLFHPQNIYTLQISLPPKLFSHQTYWNLNKKN